MHAQPVTLSTWTAELAQGWNLTPSPLTHLTPLRLVATTRSGYVVSFSGAGTTLRLAVYEASAVVVVKLRPECDCGEPHGDKAASRVQLDRSKAPVWQGSVDTAARFGWRGVDAALPPQPQAAAVLEELLRRASAEVPHALAASASIEGSAAGARPAGRRMPSAA